jgi:2'-5' RNA ligase
MSVRCFIAVDVEEPTLLDKIAGVQARLEQTGSDIKCVERENVHLTLKFLGDVRPGLIDEVVEAVSSLRVEPFRMSIKGVGVFPNLRRPRVVWVGVTGGTQELKAAFDSLEPRIVGLGFKPESRRFSPHITIARVRSGRNRDRLVEAVTGLRDADFGGAEIAHVKLKKSVLTPRGPIYSDLAKSSGSVDA